MVRYTDRTENGWKNSQCPKKKKKILEDAQKAWRPIAQEYFKNSKKIWLLWSKIQKNEGWLKIFTQYCVSTLLTSSYFITHVCASDIFLFINMSIL